VAGYNEKEMYLPFRMKVGILANTPLLYLRNLHDFFRSRVISVSIVSDYGLDDRATGVRSPAGAKNISSILCVQTGSGAHPASSPMGTGVLSPGVKRGRGVMLTTHPHLVPG
jgi:hypothetical protein